MSSYHSPRGLYKFQAEFAAYCILRRNNMLAIDTGLGKGHIAMASAAVLLDDDKINHLLIVCEQNKVDEWASDIEEFTDFSYMRYRGSVARRKRILKKVTSTGVQVLITTYQTAREDLAVYTKMKGGHVDVQPNFMIEAFRKRRMMVVYDEMTVMAGRTSAVHRGHKLSVSIWDARILGMTATPVTNGVESFYNLGRILCPEQVGTIEEFEEDHVASRNQWHVATHFKNHDLLAQKMSGVLLRKRKTDPDVIDQFPKLVEDFVVNDLSEEHQALYNELDEYLGELDPEKTRYGFKLLSRFANHPMSIFSSTSEAAEEMIQRHPRSTFENLRCSKSNSVVSQVDRIVSQGDRVIIFCDATSVLIELAADIEKKIRQPVGHYHGRVSEDQRERSKGQFKSGELSVLLCSSAGERGINLPEASYVINYDVPMSHSSYIQRVNRASRIGTNTDGILVATTYVANGTVENGALNVWNRRNSDSDRLIDRDALISDDLSFMSAANRKEIYRIARKLHKETAA